MSGARDVAAFLESYRAAFERLDGTAIAAHFAYPCHVTGDAGGEDAITPAVFPDQQSWLPQIERLLGMYRAIGFSGAGILDLATGELSPRLAQATVHWELHDGAGRPLYDFQAAYTLAEIGRALRIVAVAHNEIPQYRAYLARA
jgi:hypothetical protein